MPATIATTRPARSVFIAHCGMTAAPALALPPDARVARQRYQPQMDTAINMTWRPAWPSMVTGCGLPTRVPKKTVRSSRLPRIPTGHAHTLRRMPPSADARPNALPRTSRTRRDWSPTWICASKSHRRMSMILSSRVWTYSGCAGAHLRRLRGEEQNSSVPGASRGGCAGSGVWARSANPSGYHDGTPNIASTRCTAVGHRWRFREGWDLPFSARATFHPDCTVGTGFSPVRPSACSGARWFAADKPYK